MGPFQKEFQEIQSPEKVLCWNVLWSEWFGLVLRQKASKLLWSFHVHDCLFHRFKQLNLFELYIWWVFKVGNYENLGLFGSNRTNTLTSTNFKRAEIWERLVLVGLVNDIFKSCADFNKHSTRKHEVKWKIRMRLDSSKLTLIFGK